MFAPIDFAGPQPFNDWFAPDTTQRHPLGLVVKAYDPFWGYGEFMYVDSVTTMEKGTLARWDETYTAEDYPNTANLGMMAGILMMSMVTGQFGWLQLSGFAPASAQASVAADTAVGVAAAGQLGANSAGKQALGVRNRKASTATLAKTNVQTTNNSAVLKTSGYDGWFVGMALSGTGIPASTIVAKLDPDGRTVYMGATIGTLDKLATATGSVTVTGTWTGYIGPVFDNIVMQGAIT